MKIGHCSSSESKPCIKCGEMTATYKVYHQSNMEISIPLCNRSYGKQTCYDEADIKKIATKFLIEAKKAILLEVVSNG